MEEFNDKAERDKELALSRLAAPCICVFFAVLFIGFLFSSQTHGQAAKEVARPAHVSAKVCAECHSDAYEAWQRSHHAWALKHADEDSVLADFKDAVFDHKGVRSRFFQRDGKFHVETDGPDGNLTEYEVLYSVGVEPLQQYLVELNGGRLQALDIAWDTQNKRWFHLYPDQKLESDDGFHWTGPYKNWNGRCAVCHQTNYNKGYLPQTKSYQSKWSELTVACEACHGAGEAHVEWAKQPKNFDSKQWHGVDARGLSDVFSKQDPKKEIELCAACHSRRSALDAKSPVPGSAFSDDHRLALLRNGLYHADGQINDEVYVYGSFLQSKMYERGVRCSNCHEPHSGDLVATGNAVCTQCHNPAGNSQFGSLKRAAYDTSRHHHHDVKSEGAKCVSCHMPSKTYMQVDPRRDHSFRVPRPDLSQRLNTPNACNTCHQDKTVEWATSKTKEWFPDGQSGTPHYGEVLDAGRRNYQPDTGKSLVELAHDRSRPAIVRATALNLLRQSADAASVSRAMPLLKDPEDLVRLAGLGLLDRVPQDLRAGLAAPSLADPVRAVRLEAARIVLTIPPNKIPKALRADVQEAIGEFQRSLRAQADFPETQMQIAGIAMVLRNFAAAEQALKTAVGMDPQLAAAWLTLARIQAALGKSDETSKTLEQAAELLPTNGEVFTQLGAIYTSKREHKKAITALEKSLKLSGSEPTRLELLAQNHMSLGEVETAVAYAKKLASAHPDYRPGTLLRQLLDMQQ